jgi:hypothetical protein
VKVSDIVIFGELSIFCVSLNGFYNFVDSEELTSLIKFSVTLHLDEKYKIRMFNSTPPNGRC